LPPPGPNDPHDTTIHPATTIAHTRFNFPKARQILPCHSVGSSKSTAPDYAAPKSGSGYSFTFTGGHPGQPHGTIEVSPKGLALDGARTGATSRTKSHSSTAEVPGAFRRGVEPGLFSIHIPPSLSALTTFFDRLPGVRIPFFFDQAIPFPLYWPRSSSCNPSAVPVGGRTVPIQRSKMEVK